MTPRQSAMYWAEWSKLRDVLRARGVGAADIEARRGALTVRALGAAKSSKAFTNADLDRVIAAIKAETQPADLNAQLRQIDQPENRRAAAFTRLRTACTSLAEVSPAHARLGDQGSQDRYLSGLAQRVIGKWPEQCTEADLAKLAGIVEKQLARAGEELAAHREKVLHDHQQWASAGRPTTPAAKPAMLVPGEDF